MKKVLFFVLLFFPMIAFGQASALNEAKYLATLQVISKHKLNDASVSDDVNKLRAYDRFEKELSKMVAKLDNSRPNEGRNRKIMRILERAGREIYNELK
jgi:hypothetical protein